MGENWKDIKSMLVKAGGALAFSENLKNEVVYAVNKILNINVPASSISLKRRIVFVSAHPAVKNEIAMKKEKILKILQERGFGKRVINIK